jgi:hypothetical protein
MAKTTANGAETDIQSRVQAAEVEIKGLTPGLLMHSFPLVPIEAIEKKTPAEQAELAAYRDPETRELYIPGIAVQRAFVSGATYSKGIDPQTSTPDTGE